MGTYSDSKITVARKSKQCASSRCSLGPIERGSEQLAYKQGLKSTIYFHLDCALANLPHWHCRALEKEAQKRALGRNSENS